MLKTAVYTHYSNNINNKSAYNNKNQALVLFDFIKVKIV